MPLFMVACVSLTPQMVQISSRLMDVGSHLATPLSTSKEHHISRASFDESPIQALETLIDSVHNQLTCATPVLCPSHSVASLVVASDGGIAAGTQELHSSRWWWHALSALALGAVLPFVLRQSCFPPSLSLFVLRSSTIARRAERHVVPLVEREDCDAVILRYLNRLSDFLFVASRLAAKRDHKPEQIYQKPLTAAAPAPAAATTPNPAAPAPASSAAAAAPSKS